MIWLFLFIPLVVGLATWLAFPDKVTWQEIIIGFGAGALICALICGAACGISISSQTTDIEYLTGWIKIAEYHEPWTEEWVEIVIDYDEKGNITGSHPVVHTDHHPEYWIMFDTIGDSEYINRSQYQWFCRRFGNETKHTVFHINQVSVGDGNKYQTVFPGGHEKLVPRTITHRYENRIQASRSVFRFPEVEPEGLFDYPQIGDSLSVPSILGSNYQVACDNELCKRNAELGARKQVRVWLLIFDNQPIQRAIDQQSFWQGGNKNEFVVCIGRKGDKVAWAFVFSWCENERLKADVKSYVQQQQELDLMSVVKYTTDEVEKRFIRKQFKDFNYLDVQPSTTAIIVALVLTTLTSVGVGVLLVKNDFANYRRR